jgi:carboxypeptidase PM20D1
LIGVLEAAELLLERGFKPKRTIYFAFGHGIVTCLFFLFSFSLSILFLFLFVIKDEEIGGEGAAKMLAYLKKRDVTLEFVIYQGGAMVSGSLPVKQPVAGTERKKEDRFLFSLLHRHLLQSYWNF